MNRFIAFSKIFTFGFLFFAFQSGFAQNLLNTEEILKKYNIDPTEIPAEDIRKIEEVVRDMQTEGRSEDEILSVLRDEGLIPDTIVVGRENDSTLIDNPDPNNPEEPFTQEVVLDSTTENTSPTKERPLKPKPKPLPKPEPPSIPKENMIFGHHIFFDTTQAFVRAIPSTPPPDYKVGPGDIFNVTIWGCSELSQSLTVKSDGSIFQSFLGKIYLGGMTYVEAQSALMRNYRKYYSSCSQIEIFMGRSKRTITVNIVGEVLRPGAYKINAATPAFNALFDAGGVTEKGSVRNIAVKRNGKIVQILDVYEYLIGGEDQPIFLQDNDFLFIPVQDKIVRISGAVQRESLYELREDEQLKSLILFSGGLSFFARTEKARIDRFELGEKNILNFELAKHIGENNPDYELIEGDHVQIRAQNMSLKNYVGVRGSVKFADNYQFEAGDRISDLIDRAGGLDDDALIGQAYLVRKLAGTIDLKYIPVDISQVIAKNPAANLPLVSRDILHVFSNLNMGDTRKITIAGEVRNPGIFENGADLNLKTLLFLANGPKSTANYQNIELLFVPEIEEFDAEQLEDYLGSTNPASPAFRNKIEFSYRVSLRDNWQNDPSLDSVLLFPFNQIHVYSKYDFIQYEMVNISGAVEAPGSYRNMDGMNLKDLLYQAKGVVAGIDKVEIELHRKIPISEKGDFGTKPTDNEVFRFALEKDWESVSALDNISLNGIDKVFVISETVFYEPTYIHIKGEVRKPGRYPMSPNMTLKDLLYKAEGMKINADVENIEMTRIIELEEDGRIMPTPLVQQRIGTIQDWRNDSSLDKVFINAFDQVFVRRNPDFEIQESVYLEGEFILPGEYNKIRKNERISSLVKRASGATELADLEGAFITRQGISGQISLKLKKALSNPGGKHDIPLLNGDRLSIPPLKNTVTILGNVLEPGVTVMYEKGKNRYKYYVRNYAGGFKKKTLKRNNTITYSDGSVRAPSRFFWKKFYPKVEQGSTLNVAAKPEKEKKEKTDDDRFRINTQELIASLTAILTFGILLRNSVN